MRRTRDAGQLRTPHFIGNALLFGTLTADAFFTFGFLAFFLFFEALFLSQTRFLCLSGFFGFAILGKKSPILL